MNDIDNLDLLDDELPVVSQRLTLVCDQCGKKHRYDVGFILNDPTATEADKTKGLFFSNYFRCVQCQGHGPWTIHNRLELLGRTLRSIWRGGSGSVASGRPQLFDRTPIQSPAMAEDHLKALIANDLRNVFLHTRLGNVFRICGHRDRARQWYEKAIAINPRDIEGRFHLYRFAIQGRDYLGALEHARSLSRFLCGLEEEGRPEDERALDFIYENFLALREQFEPLLRERCRCARPRRDDLDLLGLLLEEEEDEAAWDDTSAATSRGDETAFQFSIEQFVPSLREVVERDGLHLAKTLTVALRADEKGRIHIPQREDIIVYDGRKGALWRVASLRELFRGNESPPPDINRYPPEYATLFFSIEKQVLTACASAGDRTDHECEEIYSNLRRRPDGRSLGPVHDAVWQVAALLLAMRPLSQAQFEAICGQLARTARHWKEGASSRNYIAYIRRTFDSIQK
jgi:tetratricopeptide (TPR) repeat protein